MIYLLTDLLIVGSLTEAGAEGNKVYSLLCLWLVSLIPEISEDIREKEALVGDMDLCFAFVDEHDEVRLVLQARSPEEKDAWLAAITKSQSDMNHAIRKGSDIESQKVHVAETVQWAKPLMPSEIANALKEVQAEKISSSKAQYRTLREETPEDPQSQPTIRDTKKSGSSRIRRVLDRSSGILSSVCSLPQTNRIRLLLSRLRVSDHLMFLFRNARSTLMKCIPLCIWNSLTLWGISVRPLQAVRRRHGSRRVDEALWSLPPWMVLPRRGKVLAFVRELFAVHCPRDYCGAVKPTLRIWLGDSLFEFLKLGVSN